jgi:hypothetical protein
VSIACSLNPERGRICSGYSRRQSRWFTRAGLNAALGHMYAYGHMYAMHSDVSPETGEPAVARPNRWSASYRRRRCLRARLSFQLSGIFGKYRSVKKMWARDQLSGGIKLHLKTISHIPARIVPANGSVYNPVSKINARSDHHRLRLSPAPSRTRSAGWPGNRSTLQPHRRCRRGASELTLSGRPMLPVSCCPGGPCQ